MKIVQHLDSFALYFKRQYIFNSALHNVTIEIKYNLVSIEDK